MSLNTKRLGNMIRAYSLVYEVSYKTIAEESGVAVKIVKDILLDHDKRVDLRDVEMLLAWIMLKNPLQPRPSGSTEIKER